MFRNLFVIGVLVLFLIPTTRAAEDTQSLIGQGDRMWGEQKVKEAEDAYKRAVAMSPESSAAYARLAALYASQNRTDEAIENYQEAIIRDPENPKLFAALGLAYLHQGRYSMAGAMTKEALRLDPDQENLKKMLEYISAKKNAMAQRAPGPHPGMPTDDIHQKAKGK